MKLHALAISVRNTVFVLLLLISPPCLACSCGGAYEGFREALGFENALLFESLEGARDALVDPLFQLPANVQGLVWRRFDRPPGRDEIKIWRRRAGESVSVEMTARLTNEGRWANVWLVAPAQGFQMGEVYEISSRPEGSYHVQYLVVEVVDTRIDLSSEGLELDLSDVSIQKERLPPTSVGACSDEYLTSGVNIRLKLPAALEPYRRSISYRTYVDGRRWTMSNGICTGRYVEGVSRQGPGRERLVRDCGYNKSIALEGADLRVSMNYWIPGSEQVFRTPEIEVNLSCPGDEAYRRGLAVEDVIEPEMVTIEAGSVMLGHTEFTQQSALPRQQFSVEKPFAVGSHEVTFREYEIYARLNGIPIPIYKSGFVQEPNHPIMGIRWRDAKRYVNWLAKVTGKQYRLLTEKEWEYAARGGVEGNYHWGDEMLTDKATCCLREPTLVGSYPPNAFGLFDMLGNAAEFTADCFYYDFSRFNDFRTTRESDPQTCYPVTRGGHVFSKPDELTLYYREHGGHRRSGFRVALDL
ncbi:MAG: SUMF1/EgtB/PvdO family nonheme iron enzyme [Gammaproteobacteria bacterium]|jgi:formylglycine-generating enzyme required for sulfatase activity|nr:SUMF1/EgtB/PvdO family nonheme iron enzyme [Gammaproteobacteria bacterium]